MKIKNVFDLIFSMENLYGALEDASDQRRYNKDVMPVSYTHLSGNGSHEHSVTLPKVKAGDTVLVTWVKNTPVVVDVVKKS